MEKMSNPYIQALVAQGLKTYLAKELTDRVEVRGLTALTPTQRESLEMICSSIGHIVSGDASDPAPWSDIMTMAHLANVKP